MKVDELADHVIKNAGGHQRFMIAIAGPPGAGKSTLAEQLKEALVKQSVGARIIPMDGFHLDNVILKERDLLHRRGAANTFDAAGFVHLIRRLGSMEDYIAIPTFDRERDIAIAGAEIISNDDRILIVEGNYLLLNDDPWKQLQEYWSETVFINPGVDILEKRLVERWLDNGLKDAAARERALGNDIPNAHYVLENSGRAGINLV